MKFCGIKKVLESKFITRYDLYYTTEDNKEKTYEIISRRKDIDGLDRLGDMKPEGVVIVVNDESGEKILLNKEFRMSVGQWVYNFPAGLIDAGENAKEAATRELREETGLELYEIETELPSSYSAVGFSNEVNAVVVGKARGEFAKSSSSMEEIEPSWYTKAEVLRMLESERFAGRTQMYCYMWAKNTGM